MKKVLKILQENIILFFIMGEAYCGIELLFRGYTHWTMFILAGICGVTIGSLNEHTKQKTAFWKQILIGTGIILILEFCSGCVLNLWLGLGIWDYSNQPFNILGQICPLFALVWAGLVCVMIPIDDWLRYKLFGEAKPEYRFHFSKKK